ncbi:HD domain-containing protein [Aeromonas hydrophila]|uniref:HD domain-containing protein n=1 Tax=Aeromonas hydrophila TaxID=644 RepID=UPI003F7ACF15
MIKIPNRIKEKLETNQIFYTFSMSCISIISPWLNENKTVFFPEYTDHGLTHLKEVLLTADSIISDESWDHITSQDAAAIIVSVLLHDCAMHLTEDGFYSLIQDKMTDVSSRYIGTEKKWSEVWHDFFSEAKRFDASKLKSIFGDDTPVKKIPDNKLDLSGRDKLLIGEFIRRNHARIAHEISFYGVPGVNGCSIKLGDEPEDHFLDLCGFIARSHNMDLRSAVDKIEKRKKQVHLNTHVPFIMLILRISDYIQIHSERAPKQLLNLKTLVSPISKGEWKKHHSVVEIHQAHEDPEAIYIDAEPKDAITYEELKKLFKDIQIELDLSWSVLGETYGRMGNLRDLGITIRRIRSSLDYFDEYISEKKPTFIPKVLSFKTADSEMMELLISPLYGDKPEVGIRELMQNSVDACAELKDFKVKQGIPFEENQDFDVCITVYDNGDGLGGKLTIEDYGIGMTLDVIENYFLNIGASFRNSDRWKKEHETDGHSNVYRTGRFGIGLLAAYLLGDQLLVETRHISQTKDQALTFECRKGSKSIIISHSTFHIGTRITIDLSETIKEQLIDEEFKWDWYSLDRPKVERKIVKEGNIANLTQLRTVPGTDSKIENTEWNRIIATGYDDITWTYSNIKGRDEHYYGSPVLICNGIIISNHLYLENLNISGPLNIIVAYTPTINVFDQDGRLPINLERSDLVSPKVPFMMELAQSTSSFLVKELIDFCKSLPTITLNKDTLNEITNISVKGLIAPRHEHTANTGRFVLNEDELIPFDFDIIASKKIMSLCIDAANLSKDRGAWTSSEFLASYENYLIVDKVTDSKNSRAGFVRTFFELNTPYYSYLTGISTLPVKSRRIIIRKNDVIDIVSPGYVPKTFWNRLECEWENEEWLLMSIGDVPKLDLNLAKITQELTASQSFGFVICYLNWSSEDQTDTISLFADAWIKENGKASFSFN